MKKDFNGLGLFFFFFIIFIFVAGVYFTVVHKEKISKENYNNGICTECGNEYRFTSVLRRGGNGYEYYYTCENCGHTIMTYSIMD